ncbi:RNA-binding protein [Nitzschia inconspicua]|uniref:RNA-binding protein n=1 Tax=Nitzschia inconspicua TaxID=303405 RepID=A0A9K3PMB3_9STRA|nr:RNA-binding protein [Nitzschia inconspicua]
MTTLLGSIFGGGDGNPGQEPSTTSGLFDKSESLPDRPQHKPVARRPSNKRKQEDTEDSFQNNPPPVDEKKKRKKKNRKSSDGGNEYENSEEKESRAEILDPSHDKVAAEDTSDSNDMDGNKTTEEERTIFVGNLPLATTTRKSLAAIFKDCGPIVSARIRSVPVKGIKLPQSRAGDQRFMKKVCVNTRQVDEESFKNSVQGYVVFRTVDAVSKALEKNNLSIDGMRIRVDRASPTVDPSRSVFVGGLPYAAEESTLQEHFVKGCDLQVQDVEGVRIVRDNETFQCKGFGYVLLREKSMVPTALKLHESVYMKKPIRVLVCGKRFKGKKGQKDVGATPKYKASQSEEKITVGAFRRIIAKQQQEALQNNKRKRGDKKKFSTIKASAGGLSKRAAIDKKVEKKVKKLQKRLSKGMGKSKRG